MMAQRCPLDLIAGRLLQQFWADEQHELAAAERHIIPVVGCEIEDRKPRRREVGVRRLFAAASPLPVNVNASSCMPGLCPTRSRARGSLTDARRMVRSNCAGSAP